MLFNSYAFLFVFLPCALGLFFALAYKGWRKAAVLSVTLASLVFYGYWDPAYLPLLLGSIWLNFLLGRQLSKQGRGIKLWLYAGVSLNLLVLGYYKYSMFFLQTLREFGGFGGEIPQVILPLGISFFTFTQIAYLVDAYRGETKQYGWREYSLFVTFFPHLIAGPVLYHKNIIPQFGANCFFSFSSANFAKGLSLFSLGLFKKVMLADTLAPWTNQVFSHAATVSFGEAWLGALCYTLQLYFDFSGYSEMAMGLGWMLNVRLPLNFDKPYKTTNIADFWRRWHMTLSAFLRYYLYIPLGGNRQGPRRQLFNLFLTMLLGGLWHGAGWTYVLWGALHGLYLMLYHTWKRWGLWQLPAPVAWLFTFGGVVVGLTVFRAASLADAAELLQAMFWCKTTGASLWQAGHIGSFAFAQIALLLGLTVLACRGNNMPTLVENMKWNWAWAVSVSVLGGISLLNLSRHSEFLYFQF